MQVHFFATFRQIVGGKTVDLPVAAGCSVQELVDVVVTRWPELRTQLLDEQGNLYQHVHVFVNGRDAPYLADGMATRLAADDVVNIFPPVAGGAA